MGRVKRGIYLLAFLLIVGLTGCSESTGHGLTVYGFSAGAADAFLITTENHAVLIDCAEKNDGSDLRDYLQSHGIRRLDYLIITHYDKDHIGGAKKVIPSVKIGQVLQSGVPKDSDAYRNYLQALDDAGIDPVTVTEDLSFTLDDVTFFVDAPAGGYTSHKSNNSSLIVEITYENDRLLFMGDAQDERISEFLAGDRGSFDFLKVPHHGRLAEQSAALISSVKPEIAVITSSDDEPESDEVVSLLEEAGAEVYLTKKAPVFTWSTGDGLNAAYDR